VRFIAATNRDLTAQVSQGLPVAISTSLCVFPIKVPPCAPGRGIPVLVDHFLAAHIVASERLRADLTEAHVRTLKTYDWPGTFEN